jgi:hypothetical protein
MTKADAWAMMERQSANVVTSASAFNSETPAGCLCSLCAAPLETIF